MALLQTNPELDQAPRPASRRPDAGPLAVAVLVAAAAAALMLATSPTHGDFWWFDAPSHAMNGVFIRDFVAAAPFHDPVGWAIDYYLRYPALTILFYPPLFPVVEAAFFAVFGISHFVAQLAVCAFLAAMAIGTYGLARSRLTHLAALGAMLMTLGLPGVAFWGRQVMLEMPAWAMVIWGYFLLVRYLEGGRPPALYLSIVCLVGSLYIKQTFAFALPVATLSLLWCGGWSVLRRREVWLAAAAGVLLLLPLAGLTYKFGMNNFGHVSGATMNEGPSSLLASLTWYARALPHEAGWLPLALALGFILLQLRDRSAWRDPFTVVLLLSVAISYAMFTFVALKEDRYAVHILVPFGLMATATALGVLPRRWADLGCLTLGAAVFAATLLTQQVPFVDGHARAAALVAANAPANATVLFSGQRSANFVFALRANSGRSDLRVLRAEKLMVHYRQFRGPDLRTLDVSPQQIAEFFPRYRISHAVFESGFWTDLAPIAALDRLLGTDQFAPLEVVQVASNVAHNDRELRVLAYRGPLPEKGAPFEFDMPLIGSKFSGQAR